ncbi:MAG: carboxypeptidase-like regulatory domain-containing protein [Prevotellaceae bacterium]|jgi:hypothetical protein|nr:carboxypeptidase-like regulatory domain-containing protein [Prevotellaceae bacterium]
MIHILSPYKPMKRTPLLLLTVVWGLANLSAQNSFSGKVVDKESAEALPYANVVVVQEASHTPIGTTTGEDGTFTLAVAAEKLRVKVSYLGYITKDTTLVPAQSHVIRLAPDATLLGEVTVKAARVLHKLEGGGIATDIANSPLTHIMPKADSIMNSTNGIPWVHATPTTACHRDMDLLNWQQRQQRQPPTIYL